MALTKGNTQIDRAPGGADLAFPNQVRLFNAVHLTQPPPGCSHP